jgi:XTP/dITP diphosphohydrolase
MAMHLTTTGPSIVSPPQEFPNSNSYHTAPANQSPVVSTLLRVASSNAGKIAEFRLGVRLWREQFSGQLNAERGTLADLMVESVPGIETFPECVEDGDTFSANARKKAIHYSHFTRELVVADDSGLEVDALGGLPGVRSRRYAGASATDAQNNAKLLDALRGLPAERRGAQFVCVLALTRNGIFVAEFKGTAWGVLLDTPRGGNGFGYDPLFFDPECNKTFAELLREEKLGRSHRGRALWAMFDWLSANPQ